MVKEVIWLKRSRDSFEKVIRYLESNWSNKTAEEFYLKTEAVLKILKEQPRAGSQIKQRKVLRQFLISKHNYLVYKVFQDKLIVVNIIDTRKKTSK